MNPENRFRMLGVLALAGLISYAVYGGAAVTPEAPAVSVEQSTSGDS